MFNGGDEIDRGIKKFDQAFELISKWINELTKYPGFKSWKAEQLGRTLEHHDPLSINFHDIAEVFEFPLHINEQHEAIMAFLSLHSSWQAIADTEFYFRRYPFRKLPISMDLHLRYTCENFFSRIYEFSERMKKCLNALNKIISKKINVGKVIKSFAREFKYELKERNRIHHNDRFDEIMIHKIALTGLLATSHNGRGDRGWKYEHRRAYRTATHEWVLRVRKRSNHVRLYLDLISGLVIENCQFLSEPIPPQYQC